MSGTSQQHASRAATALLVRSLPGARRGSVTAHLARAGTLAEAIWQRWHVLPAEWRAKHLRWFLEVWTARLSPTSRYDYFRTARALAVSLGRWDNWEPQLRGPWVRPTGEGGKLQKTGRPAKLPGQAR